MNPDLSRKQQSIATPEPMTIRRSPANEIHDQGVFHEQHLLNRIQQNKIANSAGHINSTDKLTVDLVAYEITLLTFRTVNNDCSLFFRAYSAGLVKIRVEVLDDDLGIMATRPFYRFDRSAINRWCDCCQRIVGAEIIYRK
jgi:hypothetical protein